MNRLSPEIAAAQAAYAARKWFVFWKSADAQVPSRFEKFDDAVAYLRAQKARDESNWRGRRRIADFRFHIEGPGGVMSEDMLAGLIG